MSRMTEYCSAICHFRVNAGMGTNYRQQRRRKTTLLRLPTGLARPDAGEFAGKSNLCITCGTATISNYCDRHQPWG